VHSIPELLDAAAANLGTVGHAALGRRLGVGGGAIVHWRRGDTVPREEYSVALAQAIGVDPQYVIACLVLARRKSYKGHNREYWKRQASAEFHARSIDIIDAILGKASPEPSDGN
jgi:transcriptional regulator with XRE-family HTH domain